MKIRAKNLDIWGPCRQAPWVLCSPFSHFSPSPLLPQNPTPVWKRGDASANCPIRETRLSSTEPSPRTLCGRWAQRRTRWRARSRRTARGSPFGTLLRAGGTGRLPGTSVATATTTSAPTYEPSGSSGWATTGSPCPGPGYFPMVRAGVTTKSAPTTTGTWSSSWRRTGCSRWSLSTTGTCPTTSSRA